MVFVLAVILEVRGQRVEFWSAQGRSVADWPGEEAFTLRPGRLMLVWKKADDWQLHSFLHEEPAPPRWVSHSGLRAGRDAEIKEATSLVIAGIWNKDAAGWPCERGVVRLGDGRQLPVANFSGFRLGDLDLVASRRSLVGTASGEVLVYWESGARLSSTAVEASAPFRHQLPMAPGGQAWKGLGSWSPTARTQAPKRESVVPLVSVCVSPEPPKWKTWKIPLDQVIWGDEEIRVHILGLELVLSVPSSREAFEVFKESMHQEHPDWFVRVTKSYSVGEEEFDTVVELPSGLLEQFQLLQRRARLAEYYGSDAFVALEGAAEIEHSLRLDGTGGDKILLPEGLRSATTLKLFENRAQGVRTLVWKLSRVLIPIARRNDGATLWAFEVKKDDFATYMFATSGDAELVALSEELSLDTVDRQGLRQKDWPFEFKKRVNHDAELDGWWSRVSKVAGDFLALSPSTTPPSA